MSTKTETKFAAVSWAAEDIFTLRPDWTTEQAEEWLDSNCNAIADHMVHAGWEVIECLLPPEEED